MQSFAQIVTTSEAATRALGRRVASAVVAEHGLCLALSGDLGAGKTQFVKGFAEGVGIDPDEVTSPTFTLMHVYEPVDGAPLQVPLVHIDAYRLADPAEASTIGLDRMLAADAIALVEWAARIAELLPGPDARVDITFAHVGSADDPDRRAITLDSCPPRLIDALVVAFAPSDA